MDSRADEPQSPPATGAPLEPGSVEFFQQRILPLLESKCYECHSHASGEANGQLVVDSKQGLLNGGTRGPSLVPHQPDQSLILRAVNYHEPDLQMPPDNPLPAESVELIRQWIAAGAIDPRNSSTPNPTGPAPKVDPAQHWAYQIPKRPALSVSPEAQAWSADRMDQLIYARLQAASLTPSAIADRRTLIRRVYYDLCGLPPTEADIIAFEQDQKPDAYRRLIDRLLNSPQFGERWTRYWMDVARYADTKGYVFREERKYTDSHKYRDWLIKSFNEDLSYQDFVKFQLAGDLLDPENQGGNIPALGFLTLGRRFLNNRHDIIDDRMDVTARGLMGMTIGCARCHDHKYDPISTKDYYSMFGVFLNTDEPGGDPWPQRLTDTKENRKSFVLIRGSPGNRGEETPRRFVSFLDKQGETFEDGSGRKQLAEKIASPENPLTARVFVNRVWMRLLGASLVESPSDFGVRCAAPVQQDVLDELACGFMEQNWSVKQLVRRIVLSSTYQQSSLAREDGMARDPQNQLYWRMNRRRMDFESLRDSVLSVSNQLNGKIGGPSEAIETAPYTPRRTVYAFIDRQNVPGIFRNFDVASSDSHSPQRLPTTVPQQGLFMLNSPWMALQATVLGNRAKPVVSESEQQVADEANRVGINALFRTILHREPTADEGEFALQYLREYQSQGVIVPVGSWQCGYGAYDPEQKRLNSFTHLPNFKENHWCGKAGAPDPELGWCILRQDGGHPGNDLDHAVVRRWYVPLDGKLNVRGKLEHTNEQGDGVRASVIHRNSAGEQNLLVTGNAFHGEAAINANEITVKAGDILDFVTDCITGPNSDSFKWTVRIRYTDQRRGYDSAKEFPRELPPTPLDAWSQLAQALLLTNEFAFVD